MPKTLLTDVCLTCSLETVVMKGQTHSKLLTETKYFKLRNIPKHTFFTWMNFPVNLSINMFTEWKIFELFATKHSESCEMNKLCLILDNVSKIQLSNSAASFLDIASHGNSIRHHTSTRGKPDSLRCRLLAEEDACKS